MIHACHRTPPPSYILTPPLMITKDVEDGNLSGWCLHENRRLMKKNSLKKTHEEEVIEEDS